MGRRRVKQQELTRRLIGNQKSLELWTSRNRKTLSICLSTYLYIYQTLATGIQLQSIISQNTHKAPQISSAKRTYRTRNSVVCIIYTVHHVRNVKMKQAPRETQTLCAGCSKAEPKIFAAPQTPSRGRGTAKI